MDSSQTENPLVTTIKWLAFLIIATPLMVSDSTLFPYVFGKAIAFQSLIEIMLAVYAWLLFVDYKKTGRFNFLPKLNLLTWAFIIFFLVLTLSTIFSVDRSFSFWSKQERMDGLFNLAHFFVLFFILTGTLKEKKYLYQIFDVSLGISLIICFHAIGQSLGWYFLPYGERITATLGNAAFLATYLIFNIYFAFLLLIHHKNLWARIWYALMIILQIFILFVSATRGAIYGFIAGLLVFSFLFIFFSKKNKYKKFAIALLLIVLISSISLFSARHTNFVKKNHILYRITDISLTQGTGITRIISWKIGLTAFLEKPVLGWGQENYYVAFNKHMNPIFFVYSGETFDRAHNKIVDILVMDGILGLLAYLFLFIAAFLVAWKHRRKAFATSLVLISLLITYFIQNLFLFDMPISYLMFFLSLSAVNILCASQQPKVMKNATQINESPAGSRSEHLLASPRVTAKSKKSVSAYPPWLPVLAWGLSILIIFLLWIGNLKPFFSSRDSIDAQRYLAQKNQTDETLQAALQKFKDSLDSNTFTNTETRKIFPPIILSAVNSPYYSQQLRIDALKFTAQQLETGIKEKPYFFDYSLSLIDAYNALSIENSYYLADGGRVGEKMLENYPNVSYLYYKFIINRILAGDFQSAITAAKKSVQLNPTMSDNNWYLGLAFFYGGDIENAKIYIEKSISLGHSTNDINSLFQLGQIYAKAKDFDKAIFYYQKAQQINPAEFQIQLELAKTYKNAGQIDKAKELAKQLQASSTPATASVIKEFIDSLK